MPRSSTRRCRALTPADPTTRGQSPHDVTSGMERGVAGLTLGVPRAVFWEDCDAEVEAPDARGDRPSRIPRRAGDRHRVRAGGIGPPPSTPGGLVIAAEAYDVNRRLVDSKFDDLDPIVAFRLVKGRDVPRARVPGDGARMGKSCGRGPWRCSTASTVCSVRR